MLPITTMALRAGSRTGARSIARRLYGVALGWVLLSLLQTPLPAQAGDSLRCGSRLVNVDALAAQVVALCGEPDWRDTREYAQPRYSRYVADSEVWYYNFGPSQLIRVLTFRDGRLKSVDTDGYGFVKPPKPPCRPGDIIEGLSKFRLYLMCGEPISKKAESVTVPYEVYTRTHRSGDLGYSGYEVPIYREEWVYNFGPSYFLREVTLENGVVTDVQNGDRGFDSN